jgi:hypothetical protein
MHIKKHRVHNGSKCISHKNKSNPTYIIKKKINKYLNCLMKNKKYIKLQKALLKYQTLESFIQLLIFFINAINKICKNFNFGFLYAIIFNLYDLNGKPIFRQSVFFTLTSYIFNTNFNEKIYNVLYFKYMRARTFKIKCKKTITNGYATYHNI